MQIITSDSYHLTANEKKAIRAMFEANIMNAKVGRKVYLISKLENEYVVNIKENVSNDLGIIVEKSCKANFKIKE